MQGLGKNVKKVLVLGATNLPWDLDTAMRRRFEKRIYIPLPDDKARFALFVNEMKKEKHSITKKQFFELSMQTEGFSGSDISQIIKNACFEPLRKLQNCKKVRRVLNPDNKEFFEICDDNESTGDIKDIKSVDGTKIIKPEIKYEDIQKALSVTKKTVSPKDLDKYVVWTEQFGIKS